MEVVWIRQFTPYLGNVVYTFAIILAIYLVATSCGPRLIAGGFVRISFLEREQLLGIIAGIPAPDPLLAADPKLPYTASCKTQQVFVLGASAYDWNRPL